MTPFLWRPPGPPLRSSVFRAVIAGVVVILVYAPIVAAETMSGAEFFDRSAVRAIQLSDPMPPLPVGFSGDVLGVHFGFDYEAP